MSSSLIVILSSLNLLVESLNPVIKILQQDTTFTEVSIEGIYSRNSCNILVQDGNGFMDFKIGAKSDYNLSHQAKIWGEAFYTKGVKKQVVWNEVADYLLLYPYLTADSIGGDIQRETYYFKGGYKGEHKRILWGAELSYRALQEYRNIDPRPKNTVADLHLNVTLGWLVNTQYVLSISTTGQRYKQVNTIAYYSELGQSTTYHLTGLGTTYARFSGTNNNVYYTGSGGGTTIDFLTRKSTGFIGSIRYQHFSFDKVLLDLNNLKMNALSENRVDIRAGYMGTNWNIYTELIQKKRMSKEFLYGDAANNTYPLIANANMYISNNKVADLIGNYQWNMKSGGIFNIKPTIGYDWLICTYQDPKRILETHHLKSGLSINTIIPLKKHVFTLQNQILYTHCLGSKKEFSDFSTNESTYAITMQTTELLQSSYINTMIDIRLDFDSGSKINWFLSSNLQYNYYTLKAHQYMITAKIGITL